MLQVRANHCGRRQPTQHTHIASKDAQNNGFEPRKHVAGHKRQRWLHFLHHTTQEHSKQGLDETHMLATCGRFKGDVLLSVCVSVRASCPSPDKIKCSKGTLTRKIGLLFDVLLEQVGENSLSHFFTVNRLTGEGGFKVFFLQSRTLLSLAPFGPETVACLPPGRPCI